MENAFSNSAIFFLTELLNISSLTSLSHFQLILFQNIFLCYMHLEYLIFLFRDQFSCNTDMFVYETSSSLHVEYLSVVV